jgi:hypothetical protein
MAYEAAGLTLRDAGEGDGKRSECPGLAYADVQES